MMPFGLKFCKAMMKIRVQDKRQSLKFVPWHCAWSTGKMGLDDNDP